MISESAVEFFFFFGGLVFRPGRLVTSRLFNYLLLRLLGHFTCLPMHVCSRAGRPLGKHGGTPGRRPWGVRKTGVVAVAAGVVVCGAAVQVAVCGLIDGWIDSTTRAPGLRRWPFHGQAFIFPLCFEGAACCATVSTGPGLASR